MFPKSWLRKLIHGLGLLRNPYTLGVRVIVEDRDGRILLVRHSYIGGWYLPGGGVEGGESLHQAAVRELREEAGIEPGGAPHLLGVYLNGTGWLARDHVGLFHLADWSEGPAYLAPNAEILEARFFPPSGIPDTTSPATRQKLMEFSQGQMPPGGRWMP